MAAHGRRDDQGPVGWEVDLIIDEGQRLTAVEANSGQTATSELVNAGRRVADVLASIGRVKRYVVYGGETDQRRNNVHLLSWNSLDKRSWRPDRVRPIRG